MAASTFASPSTTTTSITTSRKHPTLSISFISVPKGTNFQLPKWNSQLGARKFADWNGLRHLGVPNSHYIVKIERRGRCRRKGAYGSLFGVGAPEALVIGVVALLVFGPKGLAEVARNIGKTIRAFQPTIRELQEVSKDFKNTLEREIGLDEIEDANKKTLDSSSSTAASVDAKKNFQPNNSSSSSNESPTEEREVTAKEQLEVSVAHRKETAALAENPVETEVQSEAKEDSLQEYLKKLEEEWKTLNSEKQKKAASAGTESKSQVSDSREAVSATPLSLKTENEDPMGTAEEQLESSPSQQQEKPASAESLIEPEGEPQVL